MNSVRLKMNTSKSEFIIFGNIKQVSKCITRGLNIKGDIVCISQLVRYLGTWLDSELTLKAHVKKKCATAMLNLKRIKNIQKYLTVESCPKLWVSLCISHLDYSSSILTTRLHNNQMQRIQNYGGKLFLGKTKYESNKQALAKLHWLPIKSRKNSKY